jgi:hypothetical protein
VAIHTTDGGLKWVGGAKFPSNIAGLTGVACPTTSTCEAVGSSYAISSGYTLGRGYAPLTCPGSSTCRVADGDTPAYPYALRTTDGGAKWVSTKLPTDVGALDAIACPTPSVCGAAHHSRSRRRPLGRRWRFMGQPTTSRWHHRSQRCRLPVSLRLLRRRL